LLQCHILIWGCAHLAWFPCPYVPFVFVFARARIYFDDMPCASVQGSLELASKNFITGATKIVYAIIYSLILVSLFRILQASPDIGARK
jgi:hypothetical protein